MGAYGHLIPNSEEGSDMPIDFSVIEETLISLDKNILGEEDDYTGAVTFSNRASDIYIEDFIYQPAAELGIEYINPHSEYPILLPPVGLAHRDFKTGYFYLFSQLAKEFESVLERIPEHKEDFEKVVQWFSINSCRKDDIEDPFPIINFVTQWFDPYQISEAIDAFNVEPNQEIPIYSLDDEIHDIRISLLNCVMTYADALTSYPQSTDTRQLIRILKFFKIQEEEKGYDPEVILNVINRDLVPTIFLLAYFEGASRFTYNDSHDIELGLIYLHAISLESAIKADPRKLREFFPNKKQKK